MRTLLRATVTLLATLWLLLGLLAPAQAAKAVTSLSLKVADTRIDEGTTATMTATLLRGDDPYRGVRVRFQRRDAGTTTWTTVGRATTNRAGRVTYASPKLYTDTEFRAVFAGNDRARRSTSKVRTVTTAPWLKVSDWTRVTLPDGVVTVTGTASRSLVDEVVFLEYRKAPDTDWSGGGSVRVPEGGAFEIVYRAVVSGALELRLVGGAVTRRLGTAAVYEYLGSGKLEMGDNDNMYTSQSYENNGTTYHWSYSNANGLQAYLNWVPVDDSGCTTFAGKVAVADGTGQAGDQAAFRVTVRRADGSTVLDLGPKQVGDAPTPFTVDITDADSFEMRVIPSGSVTGFFGDAGIYCP